MLSSFNEPQFCDNDIKLEPGGDETETERCFHT